MLKDNRKHVQVAAAPYELRLAIDTSLGQESRCRTGALVSPGLGGKREMGVHTGRELLSRPRPNGAQNSTIVCTKGLQAHRM